MDYTLYRICDLPPGDIRLLDESERTMAEKRGAGFIAIRCLLKKEIARRCSCAPETVSFHYGAHGKPLREGICFNISHAQGMLALAFHHSSIGIDIESIRPMRRRAAARIMCAEQLAQFCERGCPVEEFFTCWCAAEALVKWAGDSIFHAHSYPYLYDKGTIRPLFEGAPTLELFRPAQGVCGVVAYCP